MTDTVTSPSTNMHPPHSNQLSEHVFQTTSDGIIVADTEGRIIRINPAAAAMLGTTIDEVRQQTVATSFRKNRGLQSLFHNNHDFTTNIRLPKQRFALGIATTLDGGERVVILQDVTERRELDSRREALVHSIAHDLRNPLSALTGFADLITRFGDLNEQQDKFLTRIRQTATKLYDMAEPLVDLAWIEAGMPLSHRPIQVSDTINQVIKDLSPLAQSRKMSIAISLQAPMPLIMGDPERIYMAIHKLLHNAIIYSHEEQSVVIHAWSDEQEVYCSVADRGIGISDDELDLIFDRMYRSRDEHVREIHGGGLGLTIARTIITRHGGDLWAASTLGQGSTFTFVLPTAQKR